jgi:hypothetical protein
MQQNQTRRIGVIGHRMLDVQSAGYAYSQCYWILSAISNRYENVKALTAASEGADTIFSEVALAVGLPLEIVKPFFSFHRDFSSPDSIARYGRLKQAAVAEIQVNFKDRCSGAYQKSMQWVVFTCNLIVAVWDGLQQGSAGGTWQAVNLAHQLGKPLVHIDIKTKSTHLYCHSTGGYGLHPTKFIDHIFSQL